MAEADRQENTAHRSRVVDADYVLQSEEPNVPKVHAEALSDRAVSIASLALATVVMFALVAAVRGAGSVPVRSPSPATSAPSQDSRTS